MQSGAAGFDTGKGEKRCNCLAGVAWVLLSSSPFPVSNPTAPPCTDFGQNAGLRLDRVALELWLGNVASSRKLLSKVGDTMLAKKRRKGIPECKEDGEERGTYIV